MSQTCHYCKTYRHVNPKYCTKQGRNCPEYKNKTVTHNTKADKCEFFILAKAFWCDTWQGWVPVLACIDRQTKGVCNCTQGEAVCDMAAGVDPEDLGGKPRVNLVKRKEPAEVVSLNRRRPKLIKRKKSRKAS